MKFLKIPAAVLLLLGASGFDLKEDVDVYASKVEAFEQCENWKDEGNVVVYQTNMNVAEEASRLGLEHPAPVTIHSASAKEMLKYAEKISEWNHSVDSFLASHPTKSVKVHSRICDYEPKIKVFAGYENKKIQEGVWKDEDGMRGEMIKVKSFFYQ